MKNLANATPFTDAKCTVRPLQPTIGAEIGGVDLRHPLSDGVRDEIKAAILRHKVVFFRDQDITPQQHAAFAARFGRLYTHPNIPPDGEIAHIHKIAVAAYQNRDVPSDDTVKAVAAKYHTDTSWRLVPTWGAVLHALHVPEVGGDTIWVDAGAAYEGLPDGVKDRLSDLHVVHDARSALKQVGYDYPLVAHPIVRPHRETGQKILWVNFSQRPCIVGLDGAEGREILTTILDQYRQPEYQVRFSWRPHSIAFWDNRATVHYGVGDYGTFPRVLDRILIEDDAPYANI